MEITTIIGIVIAIVIMLFGIRLILKKPVEAVPSLDADLHIDPDSQTPVIPRHVRSQLSKTESPAATRVEPSLNEEAVDNIAPVAEQKEAAKVEPTLTETVQPETKAASPLDTQVVAEEAAKTEENTTSAEQENKPETVEVAEEEKEPKAAEFSLNSNIEKAEISDFNDESSILDAHLHEQKIVDEECSLANAETIISLHVYPQGRALSGEKTLKVLLKYGLRYGELACFHRYSEDGSKLLFSVLRMADTGMEGFDLETLSTEEVKGLAFFLALPHSDVQNAFDTMDSISRLIAREVDGLVYDQNQQEMTPQLREFWRHQAIDYRAGQTAEV
ncbi:cell division protein ZipA C-terminal FtsZ-binding domain-containing protein [Acinetobacter variabilis]|uniref:cell division protein ZipA C-terminal FtsZ-binding domain-containing protein n=1 Tax=Acinetobacter variabilis TaxID=70346 RepID=UPI00267411A8|nr:cell division protein ZipA C-terminal FtsZ-binding domain-containing protein [Acinetobacter variabilis]WKT72702.1 cell division protein ZipA C-terminal FtsZ-binding domain-containing protein [Acinetobacter variabilis]